MLSRVPATVLGAVLGLEGSSLNAGNFGQARRLFADTWVFPQLQDLAGSLASIINVPGGSELWTDTTDMPLLREDAKDAAEIDQVKATAIKTADRRRLHARGRNRDRRPRVDRLPHPHGPRQRPAAGAWRRPCGSAPLRGR
jgi:hypothetical protein